MHNLSAAELLTVWERTLGQSPVQQALVLLTAAYPEHDPEQLAQCSIGQRDAYLLTLRERLFGAQLNSMTACPQCQQRIELAFTVSDIRVEPALTDPIPTVGEVMTLMMEGYRVYFRLPNSLDLASIAACRDVNQARQYLLRRCLQSVVCTEAEKHDEEAQDPISSLPMTLVDAIAERMAQADAQADTRLALSCPECHHEWSVTFDIATYLREEIQHWARHLLREVHSLARAYGWREADILAMTPTRRQAYLELLEQD